MNNLLSKSPLQKNEGGFFNSTYTSIYASFSFNLKQRICMFKHILFSLISTVLFHVAFAQQNPPQTALDYEILKAQQTYDMKKYNTAATLYQKLYPKVRSEEDKQKMLFMIAESYRKSNNFKKAVDWYEQLINAKYPDPKIIYSYGLLLKNFERYEDANRQFYDYLFEVPDDADAQREMAACQQAMLWKSNPKKFTVKNIDELNTPYSDYAPFYSAGKLIWSSSRPEAMGNEIFEWTGQKCSDLFESKFDNAIWSKPSNLKGAVNTNYNEGVAWIDATASAMYFTQCNGTDGRGVNCKIYASYFQNNAWTNPEVLPFSSDSFSVGHPAMTPDGKRMFFASDMPGGFGEKDIYYIPYNPLNNKWGKPVNLGAGVNTKEDDMFPYVDPQNNVYYSSKGFKGMGGLDIYKTQDSNGVFKVAENLQYPINSGGDDFGISFVPANERKDTMQTPIAYICSNRDGGKGDDDIYSISIKPFIFIVKGKIVDKEMNTPLAGAQAALNNDKGINIFTLKSGTNGDFTAELPLNQLLSLSANHPQYFKSADINITSNNITKDSTLEVTIYLDPIPAEDYEFTLKGIYYDLDKYDLRPEAQKVLDSLTIILKDNPNITIELASHTDSRAPEDYNLKLSQKRAESCVNYLVQHGIAKDRLSPVGYGETKLVNDCADGVDCTEDQHQENRRTTFRVLSTDYKKKR
jgi:outer membrane protein OmpA-like peptidoglycan-associated protein/tetratricopeptide (TPR) repeat protein